MDLAARLKQMRAAKGVSREELSRATELSPAQIAHIEKTSDATLRELIEISTYFKADLNWFIMGAGYGSLAMDYVVLVDSKVAAGYLENKDDPTYFSQLEYFRIPGFAKSGNHRIFLVHGDSMYPTLSEDDHLVCSEEEDVKDLENGDLAVLVTEGDIVVKRVRFEGDDLILESDNPKFKAYSLDQLKVKEVWRVQAKVTKNINRYKSNGNDAETVAGEIQQMKKQIELFQKELVAIKKKIQDK